MLAQTHSYSSGLGGSHWGGNLHGTLLQLLKCAALDCFVALERVSGIWRYCRYCSPCLESIPAISSSVEKPAMWGSKNKWGGTGGCWGNGNRQRQLRSCVLLMPSPRLFCKEVKPMPSTVLPPLPFFYLPDEYAPIYTYTQAHLSEPALD